MDASSANHGHSNNYLDLIVVWIGTLFGHFTLSDAVLWLTFFYTSIRIYIVIRDELLSKKDSNA